MITKLPPGLIAPTTLSAALAMAREGAPGIVVKEEAFARHLAERLPPSARTPAELQQALEQLDLPGLYLACACLAGEPRALLQLEGRVTKALGAATHLLPSEGQRQEVQQLVLERLLTESTARTKKLNEFAGVGSLQRWLRAVVVGTAVSLRRSEGAVAALASDDALAERVRAPVDLELGFVKGRYRADFSASFRAALERLTTQERNLLRLHFLREMTLEELAKLNRVSRTTIVRWLARARGKVLSDTRTFLAQRLQLSDPEVDELISLLRSQLDVSLKRYLAEE